MVSVPRAAALVPALPRRRARTATAARLVSVLGVRGARDPLVSRRWAEQRAALAPQSELTFVDKAPHCLVHSRPRQLADTIVPFLARGPNTQPGQESAS